jgi:uncharacterized repeat protein (TIGR03806 family)
VRESPSPVARLQTFCVALLWLALGACGGGGSSDSSTAPANPPPPPSFGLDARPSNTTCVAPERGGGGSPQGFDLADAFPSLPDLPFPIKLVQPPSNASIWYAVGRGGTLDRFADSRSADSVERYLTVDATTAGEGGFFAIVFHPNWPATPEIFASYTVDDGGLKVRLSRLVITNDSTLPADYREEVLLQVSKPFRNHNGGDLELGPDGFLYWSLGDGGSAGDPQNNAQNTSRLLGKILRIDAIDVPYPSPGYRTPASNPFAGNAQCGPGNNAANCPEIYAWGFRNPWRISFDPPTGRLWAADVGQNAWEEVDIVERGGNYGWRCREGAHPYNTAGCPGNGLIDPVHEYPHGDGNGNRSITGGFVYRGTREPGLVGRYLFADFVGQRIWALDEAGGRWEVEELVETTAQIAGFSRGLDGEVYALGLLDGRVYRLESVGPPAADNIPDRLSDTGCVDPANPQRPAAGLIPYAPAAAFWSDGADKRRWLGLPNGTTIQVQPDDDWDLPAGTVIVKNFRLGDRLAETRLFMRHPDGTWAGYTYAWNASQTDAFRIRGGATRPIAGQQWIFPSETQCLACHTRAAGFVLGLETAQMNRGFRYPSSGITDNQLEVYNHIGLFAVDVPEPVSQNPSLADPANAAAPLRARARAYLHTNCSQCHQPGGPTGVDLDLRYSTSLGATGTCDALPQAGELGLPNARIVAPGAPGRSVLLERMSRRDGVAMPPLASNRVDTAGVALIADWIDSLGSCP